MKNKFSGFLVSSLISFSILGCSNSLSSFAPISFQNNPVKSFNAPSIKHSLAVQDFVQKVGKLGQKLSEEELREISAQRHVVPNGKFAPRPAMNLSEKQNLDIHFQKHGKEFKNINSAEDYLQSAIRFHLKKGPTVSYYFDITSFEKGYQSNVVKHDTQTMEFSAMRSDGAITTYYTNNGVSPKRFVPVPEDFVIQAGK